MSRHLPPHPNLEYLKKQAKESLRDMRRRDPASKLADAQHAIAREYGFSKAIPKRSGAPSGAPISATRCQALMTVPCGYGRWRRDAACGRSKATPPES